MDDRLNNRKEAMQTAVAYTIWVLFIIGIVFTLDIIRLLKKGSSKKQYSIIRSNGGTLNIERRNRRTIKHSGAF